MGGRRLQVTIRRDPDTGEWVNPTMFGDATFRTLSDASWYQGGAEEAKGLHAQVFVDMLNAGDALPCPEHAQAALTGTQEAGIRWAGWRASRANGFALGHPVQITAAARAEMYFGDRLLLWGSAGSDWDWGFDHIPIIYKANSNGFLYSVFNDSLWHGDDGRLVERVAMLKDNRGRSLVDLSHHFFERRHPDHEGDEVCLPVYLLGVSDIDESVQAKCLSMLEAANMSSRDWELLFRSVHLSICGGGVRVLPDSVRNIVRRLPPDGDNPISGHMLSGLYRFTRWGMFPDCELSTCWFLQSEISKHTARGFR